MSHISIDIYNLYKTYFSKPYIIGSAPENKEVPDAYSVNIKADGSGMDSFIGKYQGRDVMLPITLKSGSDELYLPCATLNIKRKNIIIRTAVSERSGTVKEQFSTGDWIIEVKGVMIGLGGRFPTEDFEKLIALSTNSKSVEIINPITDIIMPGCANVVIDNIEFPDNAGKHIRFKPFTISLESDYIDTLEFS